ncbi:hypothetical protein CLAFUW4_01733 [Fulvia fulva]|uniref:Uncharacterized protein n=1 Tax=Passalora fulva TaxID=5499 RepID=A0A9Q8P2R7_PASFU|nr:uncharacterized protein CLAFUR5_01729 [Fulvia fulva]KAK4636230.1 hypothetical protein CLAFUR4_01731 [Fulvia fulva]KAK4637761.1 hypothetical protein CLAFUR0_01732 [Fulvia fulva]UJO10981.1 hypothetical protein CLAFUR5_01729 [Fulvia fulva]WPV09734.1 hypothetical protein CLAFUW4_01733 [Fulvia fulva]WPV23306.1 hypothetical protein CLAFUW7_01735 [Fulvia fulva]
MSGNEVKKVTVNGTAAAYNPTTQDTIMMALLQNGGVARIQRTFQERLDETGWTQALRTYVENMFRSGEVTTYDQALKKVSDRISLQGAEDDTKSNGVNGVGGASDLTIPREAANDAAESVKKELAQVVKIEK